MDSGILTLILSTVIPISAAVGVGYGLVRSGRRLDSESLTVLAADFALPCLVFATIIKAEISWIEFSTMALAGVVSLVLLGVIGGIILRFAGLSLRVYLPSLTSGNSIYIGFPTALYAFGQTGLTQAVAFATGALILNCTVVQALTAGKVNWKEIVRSPLIFAVLLAVLVRWTQAQIPNAVLDTCLLLGGMTVPLMLVLIGASLARIPVKNMTRAVMFSLFRVGMGAAVGLAVGIAAGLEGPAKAVLILQCTMPVSVLSYIFAQRWKADPDEVAGLVVVSTWLSVLSIPALLAALAMGGTVMAGSTTTAAEAVPAPRTTEINPKEPRVMPVPGGDLLARGDTFFATGDVASTRLFFEYAATAGFCGR